MNRKLSILFFAIACVVFVSCKEEVDFSVEASDFQIGPEGGVRTIRVEASESWVASTQEPWITVSPANGRGSTECKIIIDSTLNWTDERTGTVNINPVMSEPKKFTITQSPFGYQIALEKQEVNIADYADYGKRSFEIKVKANVDFDVKIPDAANWLSFKKPQLVLDRQARPREVTLKFDWKINSMPMERTAEVVFVPKKEVAMVIHDGLLVKQKEALPIPVGTVEGDSLTLLAINRSLGVWNEYDTSEKMEHWTGVTVWKTKDDRNGRVRSAEFTAFTTKEGIPYEVQYLTAAEELFFYGNTNTMLIESLDCGPYICMLPQLKRLTIGAYGLTSLHKDFVNLTNLEYLCLDGNTFQKIPEIINPDVFPNLRCLYMMANIRYTITDLKNDTRENIGGFIEEEGFPVRFLTWNKLDTLRLSNNFLQGELPDDSEMIAELEKIKAEKDPSLEIYWSSDHKHIKDSIDVNNPFFENRKIPMVMPDIRFFTINLNRLHGKLPDWLLYHPRLDYWAPEQLVWSQIGKDKEGNLAAFDNAPTNMTYYYDSLYVNKKYNPKNFTEEQ